jgi:hypothetical protein
VISTAAHRPHPRGLGDQGGRALFAQHRVLVLEPTGAAQRATELHLAREPCDQAPVVPGFLDVVARTESHGLDGAIDAAPGRHHEDRKGRIALVDLLQQVETFAARRGVAGVVHVDEHEVEVALPQRAQHSPGRGGGLDRVALGLEQQAERLDDVRLVIRDQDRGWFNRRGHGGELSRCAGR